jgi:hypothetical protein
MIQVFSEKSIQISSEKVKWEENMITIISGRVELWFPKNEKKEIEVFIVEYGSIGW